MKLNRSLRCLLVVLLFSTNPISAQPTIATRFDETPSLWRHDNLFAWCVAPFDEKKRTPEQRARMLDALGIRNFAYDWRLENIPRFDEEIDALARHKINLLGWWFPLDADDPAAKAMLEMFKRHSVHPRLWIMQRYSKRSMAEWGMFPKERLTREELAAPVMEDDAEVILHESLKKTPEVQAERVEREAHRIEAIVKLARPYGISVALYNHNGWFGIMDNEVSIIKRLESLGVSDVGIVYNFSHAVDEFHDDRKDFPSVWREIQPYVVAINVTGLQPDEKGRIYPGEGSGELDMMRVIERSGWRGPVGIIAEMGGDAEVTLKNYIVGIDRLALELKRNRAQDARAP